MANNEFILLIQAIHNEEDRLEHNNRKRRLRNDFIIAPSDVFKKIYRFNKNTANYIIDLISPFLPDPNREEIAIPKHVTILAALHYFAQGSYQKGVGQDVNCALSQSSVSRAITLISDILVEHFSHKVHFPTTDQEKNREKAKFMGHQNGFPGIIGCIDGTHIAIQAPPTDDVDFPGLLFYNRKGFYSINTQIICGADLRILSINPRYPGSVHDSAIWSTSGIRAHLLENFMNGAQDSWLIGDSGYPLEPWLMNPIAGHDLNERELRFNNQLRSVRNTVERTIGVFKSRFRCLLGHRTMHYTPTRAAKIISACAILHNIYIEQRDIMEDDEYYFNNNDGVHVNDQNIPQQLGNWLNEGRIVRQRIINQYLQ